MHKVNERLINMYVACFSLVNIFLGYVLLVLLEKRLK
jgi:hypothetical protein